MGEEEITRRIHVGYNCLMTKIPDTNGSCQSIGVGDTVMLIVGGPAMNVYDIGRFTGELCVQWEGDDGEIYRRAYHPDLLVGLDAIPTSEDRSS
jgi:uncharacterized protein YodC (DUF2158 family)